MPCHAEEGKARRSISIVRLRPFRPYMGAPRVTSIQMPKKTTTTIQKVLTKIRPAWIERVGQELARGMEVRAGFEEQLSRFFELLEQSVTTGDPAWMEPILLDWA